MREFLTEEMSTLCTGDPCPDGGDPLERGLGFGGSIMIVVT